MRRLLACAVLALSWVPAAHAGVTNPDISVIGQPSIRWTDDAGDPARRRPVFDVGETEVVFDAALNPYARGNFTISFADDQASVEEGTFTLLRGLPGGLVLKGGRYRVGFGKLNPAHPHQLPFAGRFGVVASYLPGAESFAETGLDVSWRVPVPGDVAVTASADVLQGDSFRIPRAASTAPNDPLVGDADNGDAQLEPRPAWAGRLAAFAPLGDRSGLEWGVSATGGTNNAAAASRTQVLGSDAKAKLWTSPAAYLLLQAEGLWLVRDDAGWDAAADRYVLARRHAAGFYAFGDFNWAQRYDVGLSVESFQDPAAGGGRRTAFGAFAGLALLEETTAFRLDAKRVLPARPVGASADPAAVHEVTLRVLFSMGPHKAHQF